MSIKAYKEEVLPGTHKTFYLVSAEGINRYTGKRVQKKKRGISSRLTAERIYRELWSQCREERPDGPLVSCWGELAEKYLVFVESKIRTDANPDGFSPHVFASKKSRMKHLESWNCVHLDLVSPIFVRNYLDELETKGVSRVMTAEIQKEVKCVFGFAVDSGILKMNPLSAMKGRKVPKRRKEALTHSEVDHLLLEAKRRNHPYYFVWLMTLLTGLRRSELAGLKWTDIDLGSGLLQVRRQVIPGEGLVNFTKSRKERTVAIPSHAIPILKRFSLASAGEFVIDLSCKKWVGGHQAEVLRAFCQEIGIKEVTHHQLRATYITLAIVDGIGLGIVKENVGHSKLGTTDEYFRSSGVQLRGQMDGLKIQIPSEEQGVILPLKAVE